MKTAADLILWEHVKDRREAVVVPDESETRRCVVARRFRGYVWPGFLVNSTIRCDESVWGEWWMRCGAFAKNGDDYCGVHAAIRDGRYGKGNVIDGLRRHREWRMRAGSVPAFFYRERFGPANR